jgi:hypothetical protein
LITDNEGVGTLIQPDRGDRHSLVVLGLTLLLRAVPVTQLGTLSKQFITTLDASHMKYQLS